MEQMTKYSGEMMHLLLICMHDSGITSARQHCCFLAGLNMLNISVDTLRPDRFEQMTRRRGHDRVMDAIHNAIRLGYDPVKVGHPFFPCVQPLGRLLPYSAQEPNGFILFKPPTG